MDSQQSRIGAKLDIIDLPRCGRCPRKTPGTLIVETVAHMKSAVHFSAMWMICDIGGQVLRFSSETAISEISVSLTNARQEMACFADGGSFEF